MQGNLFMEAEAEAEIRSLRKIPFALYYNYVCESAAGEAEYTAQP